VPEEASGEVRCIECGALQRLPKFAAKDAETPWGGKRYNYQEPSNSELGIGTILGAVAGVVAVVFVLISLVVHS
jgi:hypothetical protein